MSAPLLEIDLAPRWKALAPYGKLLKELYQEHNLLTLICGFFVVLITLNFYRFLRSLNPALVGLLLLMMLVILIMHWTVTRTEPAFLKPLVDFLAPFFPSIDPVAVPVPKRVN